MTISKFTIKFLGKRETVYRVFKAGEVVQVCESMEQAQAWMAVQ